MHPRRPGRSLVSRLALLLLLVAATRISAQPAGADTGVPPPAVAPPVVPPAPTPTVELPTIEQVAARIADLEKLTARSPEQETELNSWRAARVQLELLADLRKRTDDLRAELVQLPTVSAQIEKELAEALPVEPGPTLAGATLDVLVAARASVDQQREETKAALARVTQRLTRFDAPADPAQGEPARLRARIDEITRLVEVPPGERPPAVVESERAALRAERAAAEARVGLLELEAQNRESLRKGLRLQEARAERTLRILERRATALDELVRQRREQAAAAAQSQAEREAARSRTEHPLLQEVAERNKALAQELGDIARRTTAAEEAKRTLEPQLVRSGKELVSVRENLEGSTSGIPIGAYLRTLRAGLAENAPLNRQVAQTSAEMDAVLRERVRVDREADALLDLRSEALARIEAAEPDGDPELLAGLADDLVAALGKQRTEYLLPLVAAYDTYLADQLVPLLERQRTLLAQTQELTELIESRILWVRSEEPFGPSSLEQLVAEARTLAVGTDWSVIGTVLRRDLGANPVPYALAGVLVLALPLLRRRFLSRIAKEGVEARASGGRFAPTVRALLLAIGLAALPAAALMLLVWRFRTLSTEAAMLDGLGQGLFRMAQTIFLLVLLAILCRPGSIFNAHFGWAESITRAARRVIFQLGGPLILLVFLSHTAVLGGESALEIIERLAFCALSLVQLVVVARLLHPRRGMLAEHLQRHETTLLARLAPLWYLAVLAMPAGMIGLVAAGYGYTAIQIESRFSASFRLGVYVVVGWGLLARLLAIARRRMAIDEAQRRRAAIIEAEAAAERTGETVVVPAAKSGSSAADLERIAMQAVGFARLAAIAVAATGLIVIWAPVVPALRGLEEIHAWTTTTKVVEDGVEKTIQDPVSVAEVLIALLIAGLTLTLSRNLGGILEVVVLRRFHMTPAARFALITITRYLVFLVGAVMVFGYLGIDWSKVQFLAAAVTVGLGFGLQEIFANFVSGIIVLMERQVRVGDIITVNGVTGTVSRIHMRSTTIVDWDRKELIIPNKSFVVGDVVNWSLSDSVLRHKALVGIAYGSDVELARRLLLAVAKANPRVLEDPPPLVVFRAFGDSSLNFELIVFVPHPQYRLEVADALNVAIDRTFREHGIEIAFPQRDLRLRSIDPEVRDAIMPRREAAAAPAAPAEPAAAVEPAAQSDATPA